MKNLLTNSRSSYLLALALLAIGIGVVSKKIISYPRDCQKVTEVSAPYEI